MQIMIGYLPFSNTIINSTATATLYYGVENVT